MKKDNLKRIIKQLETLLEELKSEVYSDKDSYVHPWDEHMKNTPRIINTLTKAITENLIIQLKKTPDLMLI